MKKLAWFSAEFCAEIQRMFDYKAVSALTHMLRKKGYPFLKRPGKSITHICRGYTKRRAPELINGQREGDQGLMYFQLSAIQEKRPDPLSHVLERNKALWEGWRTGWTSLFILEGSL